MVAARRRPDAWLIPFACAVVSLGAAVASLLVVLYDAHLGDAPGAPEPVAALSDVADVARQLSFVGPLPPAFSTSAMRPVHGEERADIRFVWEVDRGVPARWWVPVVAPGTGVDALGRADLDRVLSGEVKDWREVGGLPGPIVTAVDTADWANIFAWYGGGAPLRSFATYDELFAAMTPGSGIVALVPLDRVRPSVTAIAVDGQDLVRGIVSNPDGWPFAERVTIEGLTAMGRAAVPSLSERARAPLPAVIRVVATGDILQSRCSLEKIRAADDWAAALRGPMAEFLAVADLALGSLDGSIQDVSEPYGCVQTTNLTSPPEVIQALTLAGFDGLTVATNHVFDCGQASCGTKGFLRTLELLDGAGIAHVGGGRTLEEALAPAIFEVRGVRIGVLGFDDVAAMDLEATDTAPGTAPLDDDYREEREAGEPAFYRPASELGLQRFTAAIRALRARADVVIVQVQSGTEDTHDPTGRSIKALRAAIDAGADLVIGNQAHWPQAIETRGNGYIAYALGNFIFDQVRDREQTEGYLVEASFWGSRLVNVRLVPYRIRDRYRPEFVTGAERLKILADVYKASAGLPPP
jgi:poly-gamma-glutamate synthesis protein (capsule biosynthesis protein)